MYLEKYDLKGRVAAVTGGGQGIGLACAQALGEAGARVVVLDLLPDRVEAAVAELKGKGLDATGHQLDVTRSAQVEEVAGRIASELGAPASILVNNAGIAKSNVRAEDTSDEHWRLHMEVNLDGLFWCCRSFGGRMLEAGKGSIVNIGSMSGLIVNKPQPQSFYNASKAAVHHLTKSLAAEWGERGVRVNAVAPTYIETPLTRFGMEDQSMYPTWLDMTPMRRVGQPDEIASVVLFLASDAASLLTGSIVLADGGYTCW
jgi:NAD(P)-dependent dehydrogenase (short-subunit alcohol dehydrogenase family)